MQGLPYRRLAGFYFFYFAYLGAFAPFFSLYLDAAGMSAVEIGVLMSAPQLTRIVAPREQSDAPDYDHPQWVQKSLDRLFGTAGAAKPPN